MGPEKKSLVLLRRNKVGPRSRGVLDGPGWWGPSERMRNGIPDSNTGMSSRNFGLVVRISPFQGDGPGSIPGSCIVPPALLFSLLRTPFFGPTSGEGRQRSRALRQARLHMCRLGLSPMPKKKLPWPTCALSPSLSERKKVSRTESASPQRELLWTLTPVDTTNACSRAKTLGRRAVTVGDRYSWLLPFTLLTTGTSWRPATRAIPTSPPRRPRMRRGRARQRRRSPRRRRFPLLSRGITSSLEGKSRLGEDGA